MCRKRRYFSATDSFNPNDSGVGEVACAVSKTADVPDFKLLLALFGNHLGIDDLCLHLVRAVQRPGFIYIQAISSDPFQFAFETLVRQRN